VASLDQKTAAVISAAVIPEMMREGLLRRVPGERSETRDPGAERRALAENALAVAILVEMKISVGGKLGLLPPPLWGRAGEGGSGY
jgi:hypothetical protein